MYSRFVEVNLRCLGDAAVRRQSTEDCDPERGATRTVEHAIARSDCGDD